jgi:uncharacterized protein with GYD domain
MAYYLLQGKLTTAVWDEILRFPSDRISALFKSAEKLGGSIVFGAYCFGHYDVVMVLQLPDNVSAGAFAMAAAASGAFSTVETTALLAAEEGVAAMHKAAQK